MDCGRIKVKTTDADYLRETLWVLGGTAVVAGCEIRPPSAGCLTLLDFAGYPLDQDRPAVPNELLLAAFILCERRGAVEHVLSWRGAADSRGDAILATCSTSTARACRELIRSEPERQLWHAALSRMLVDVGAGFAMVPQRPDPEPRDDRRHAFDVEWLAALYTSLCSGSIPVPWEAFLWDVPLCLDGHWLAARAGHNGMHVHRPIDAAAMAADLRALKAARLAAKKATP